MGKTSIEWTDHSWPVVNGCRRVSAGCENCYAERLTATRLSQTPKYKGLARFGENGPRWSGEARLWAPHLDMPLKLKKPSRIFVCDMGDLFFDEVSDETIAAVFGVMAACPQHTFQVLTKRPTRAREWFGWINRFAARTTPRAACVSLAQRRCEHPDLRELDDHPFWTWPLPNVWLGVSCEDQATADERIPVLLDTPAALRFVSAEPLLGPVNIFRYLNPTMGATFDGPKVMRHGVDWVIVGGESGPGARPFDLAWARGLVDDCADARVACFVKQLGANPGTVTRSTSNVGIQGEAVSLRLKDRKGGDPAEWPEDLRVRQFPTTPTMDAVRAALAPGKPLNRAELARATGRTESAVSSCLTKLRARGAVVVDDGFWTLAGSADEVSDVQA